MLARNELLDYLLDTYGHCDRDKGKQNDCYWGTDTLGHPNGCLRAGWKGRACKHWHPIEGELLDRLLTVHEIS
jgi:hypothetical protein